MCIRDSLYVGSQELQEEASLDMKRIRGTAVNSVNCFRGPTRPLDRGDVHRDCRVVADSGMPTLFFEGDSHTNVIIPLGDELFHRDGYGVSVFSRGGCPFPMFSPQAGGRHRSSRYRLCEPHYQAQIRRLLPRLTKGDALVLVSRFTSSFFGLTPDDQLKAEASFAQEMGKLSSALETRGADLIVFAPMPTFDKRPALVFPMSTCQVEWFRPCLLYTSDAADE